MSNRPPSSPALPPDEQNEEGKSVSPIEPELLVPPPRPVRWSAKTKRVRLWWLGSYAAALLVFVAFAYNDLAIYDALLARGVSATATITGKSVLDTRRTSYYLDYSFKSDSGTCTGSKQVSRAAYDAAREGGTFPVAYLPGSGGRIRRDTPITKESRKDSLFGWETTGGEFSLLFAALFLNQEGFFRYQRRLLHTGVPVVARVGSRKTVSGRGGISYLVEYSYVGGGRNHSGTVTVPSGLNSGHAHGSRTFTVLYEGCRSDKSRPYFALTAAEIAAQETTNRV